MNANDWNAGEPCEKHGMGWCGECLATSGQRRDAEGAVRFQNDCTVATVVELTGLAYDDAVEWLRLFGYRDGRGLPATTVVAALEEAGYRLTRVATRNYNHMIYASERGERYYVSGVKGKRGHAWSIIDGKANRPFWPPFTWRAWRVEKA